MAPTTRARAILALLTSDAAGDLLHLALTGRPDARLASFEHAIERVHHRPDRDTSVRYRVRFAAGDGIATDRLVLSTGRAAVGGPGVVELRAGDHALSAWRLPGDPALPAIAACHDATTATAWLAAARIDPLAEADSPVTVDVVGYRPLRRATMRMRRGASTVYVKTAHGDVAAALSQRHRLAASAGVGPDVLAEPLPGTLLLRAADGVPFARALADAATGPVGSPAPVDPASFLDLLDRLPSAALDLPRRASWTDRLPVHARAAADVHPRLAERIARAAERVASIVAVSDAGPAVSTHGDAGVANLVVRDGRVAALLDADTLGPGHRVDDLACALAHLAVLPSLARTPERARVAAATLVDWHATFEAATGIDAAALRARVAAVLLTLVTAARPSLAAERLALAEAWLIAASRSVGTPSSLACLPSASTPSLRSTA